MSRCLRSSGCLRGAALGIAFFLSLKTTATLYARGGAALAIALHAGRLAVAAGGFWFAATAGAVPLIAALAGFLAARYAVTRAVLSRGAGTP